MNNSHCLNPNCQKPTGNPLQGRFCQHCGTKLLLQERYRALTVIGQGGFGKTFLALDERNTQQSHCVIKQFFLQGQSSQVTQKAIELFKLEARRLKKLGHHSQIPELYSYLEQNNQLYIIQEYVQGNTLAKELQEKGAFSEAKIRSLLSDLLPLLHFVHQGQVIHRDIKPDNIIRRNTDQKLVLVDFGAAKEVTQTTLKRTGTIIGSLGFAAPEQSHGKAVFASDIFSLGVTCIYLLTEIDPSQLYDPIENRFIWRNKVVNPIGKNLATILDKMTHALVRQRYQSAHEVLQALKQIIAKVPNVNMATAATRINKPTVIQTGGLPVKKTVILLATASSLMAGSGFWGWKLLFPRPSAPPSPVSKSSESPPASTPLPSPPAAINPTPQVQSSPNPSQPKATPSSQKPASSVQKNVETPKASTKAPSVSPSKPTTSAKKSVTTPAPSNTRPPKNTVKATPPPQKKVIPPQKTATISPPSKPPPSVQNKPIPPKTNHIPPATPAPPKVQPTKKVQVKPAPSIENTVKSQIVRRQPDPIVNQQAPVPTQSVSQPWEVKTVPNPTSEIENTIRSNQP
ncbi:MAG: protein kinase [Snowella sp.]|nr:protein kinase [Snowella sp.]